MSSWRKSLAIFVSGVALLWTPGTVAASGSPPDTYLRSGGERLQKGVQGSYCWGDMCSEVFNSYPTAVTLLPGDTARIRVRKSRKPDGLVVQACRRLNERGFCARKAAEIRHELDAVRVEGRIAAWDAVFTVEGRRHFYTDVFGTWGDNDSSWKFHFRSD